MAPFGEAFSPLPKGSIDPVKPAFGSVVGLPSTSKAHPLGIILPSFAATISLPLATSLKLKSIINGVLSRLGKIAAIGSVPKIG